MGKVVSPFTKKLNFAEEARPTILRNFNYCPKQPFVLTLGSLSTRVFETRTATGNELVLL